MNRVRLILLTGFLGAGKTTLLRRLLGLEEHGETAVVINEAGPGLDHLLLERDGEEITLLPNGCMCCRSKGSLSPALATLLRRRAEMGSPPFERVVVETSGLADPSPILQEIASDPICERSFSFAGMVTVVDARAFDETLARHPVLSTQVGLADRLLITKTDLVTDENRKSLSSRLGSLNPHAQQIIVPYNSPVTHDLWPEALDLFSSQKRSFPESSEAKDSSHIDVASLTFGGRLSDEALEDWLEHTMMLFGPSLLRLKAILDLKGSPVPVVVHGVQGVLHAPAALRTWPKQGPFNRVVLIGDDIDKRLLEDALTRLVSRSVAEGAVAQRDGVGAQAGLS